MVGIGSSVPELTVSVIASSSGRAAASIGNVIGSNVFNALFILGVANLIAPLIVRSFFLQESLMFLLVPFALLLCFVGTDF